MPHWRNLLYVVWLALAQVALAAPGNIQGVPTPYMYLRGALAQFNSSYDGMTHYANLSPLNGLTNANPASLGASFKGSAYVSGTIPSPVVLAYDNTVNDPVGVQLNQLPGPVGWAGDTKYQASVNYFPKFTYDNMAGYQAPAFLAGLNLGADNGDALIWTGAYVTGNQPPAPGTCTPPGQGSVSIASLGTTVTDAYYTGAANPGIHGGWEGFQFTPTRDFLVTGVGVYNLSGHSGSCGNNYVIVQLTGNSLQSYAFVQVDGVPTGQFVYGCLAGPFLCKSGVTYNIVANEISSGGCSTPFPGSNSVLQATYVGIQGPYTYNSCISTVPYFVSQTNTSFVPIDMLTDEGMTWSNQVVLNGGAAPSTATTTAVSTFSRGIIADGLWGAMQSVNPIAPDSLIAAQTPIPVFTPAGSQPYVNHNFVGADVSVNGLTGDGATKYLDTGFNPATVFGSTGGGLSLYAYTVTGTGGANSFSVDATPHRFGISAKFSDTHTYGENGFSFIDGGVSPGNGFYSDNRTGATAHSLYFANSGSAWASLGSESATFTAYPSLNIPIHAANNPGSGGITVFSTGPISYVSFHNGFVSTDGQKEYNRVQTLRTSLGGGFR